MFLALLKAMAEHKVEYILIGGMAGVLHGSARLTQEERQSTPPPSEQGS